ncbi:hypothetical protein AYL99_09820 [Fonsecaea erecta]|uniref:Uncharacterized protein n=1 Tax=Fonsecaea erecta TaxID=1367422 RepID=A0A178Z7A5_9EURO|nr:hypothetical protein AYL99_09820 [Fonsecaea erecta]OAP55668.1 hypothetical protein AYL99_09820 [Fonsecaea erecta]
MSSPLDMSYPATKIPIDGPEAEDIAGVTATDLAAYDDEQLNAFMRRWRKDNPNQKFYLFHFPGVEKLGTLEGNRLEKWIRDRLPFDIGGLQLRLENLARTRGDSPEYSPPYQRFFAQESTQVPSPAEERPGKCLKELIQDGGRAVCSMKELAHIVQKPMERYEAVQSWLHVGWADREGEAELMLVKVWERQLGRWWEFRKSQWANRGLADSELGFSAYLESKKRRTETGWASPRYLRCARKEWQDTPSSLEFPNGQTFSAYINAVKRRLAPYHFTQKLQLRKCPLKQTRWTDWLEYVSFELRELDKCTNAARSLDATFDRAMTKLLGPKYAVPEWKKDVAYWRSREKSINEFVQETKTYREARGEIMYQQYRVEWAIKEARAMETELLKESEKQKNNKEKKRTQCDEGAPSSSESAPSKRAAAGGSANPPTTSGTPHPRRSTLRSAHRSAGVKKG